jgi:hypothetical protein
MPVVIDGTNGITTPDVESSGPITGTTGTLTALTVNSNNISAVNSLSFRNRIINGNMVIDQRNNGASAGTSSGTFAYFLDRWVASYSQTSKFTVQQNAGAVTPPAGFTNYLGVTSSSAYSVASGESFNMQQPIEGFNVADLGWGAAGAQTVTVSFWVRSSLTGAFGGAVCNSNLTRSYPFTYTVSAANTWEYKTVSIPGDTSGTWVTNNGVGLRLYFNLGAGSTVSGTAGAWASANFQSATGAVSVVGTNGATFYITGVQLEAGSVATPFEQIDIGTELFMCQRYYEELTSNANSNNVAWGGSYPIGGVAQGQVTSFFKVPKRSSPTVTVSAASTFLLHAPGIFRLSVTSISVITGGTNAAMLLVDTSGATGVTGAATFLEGGGSGIAKIMFSAEL